MNEPRRLRASVWLGAVLVACAAGCSCEDDPSPQPDAGRSAGSAPAAGGRVPEPAPALLYLPDGGDRAPDAPAALAAPGVLDPTRRCPPEMVDVKGVVCIDRYEARLADLGSGRLLSPYYHPTSSAVRRNYERWQKRRLEAGTSLGRRLPVPPPESWQLESPFEPKAISQGDVVPSGYLNAVLAERACRNAGKRLCRADEWILACRGEADRKFPYGDEYRQGICNVDREAHPAGLLHGNASINHLDPRLNLVEAESGPLLRPTGASTECASRWGDDAVFDMVGNLDEWVETPAGPVFQGGFYSRATREGCDARISSHAPEYFDYSLGVRCCL